MAKFITRTFSSTICRMKQAVVKDDGSIELKDCKDFILDGKFTRQEATAEIAKRFRKSEIQCICYAVDYIEQKRMMSIEDFLRYSRPFDGQVESESESESE